MILFRRMARLGYRENKKNLCFEGCQTPSFYNKVKQSVKVRQNKKLFPAHNPQSVHCALALCGLLVFLVMFSTEVNSPGSSGELQIRQAFPYLLLGKRSLAGLIAFVRGTCISCFRFRPSFHHGIEAVMVMDYYKSFGFFGFIRP